MLTSRLGSRIYGQFASTIPVIWSIGYMVIPDTWSILAGPEADLVSGIHCTFTLLILLLNKQTVILYKLIQLIFVV